MSKTKVPLNDNTLRLWLAEQIESYVQYVDAKAEAQKPRNARDNMTEFIYWLRKGATNAN